MSEQFDEGRDPLGESVAEEAPDHTPESEVETEDAELESPDTEETEESVESEDSPEEEEIIDEIVDEPLIPPDEKIDKLRIPKEDRERLKQVAKIAKETSEKLEDFGGDFAVETLKPLAGLLTKPQASDDELGEAVSSLRDANPVILSQLVTGFTHSALMNADFGDPILQAVFGDNASIQNIKTLLKLDKEGFVDKDFDFSESELVESLKEEIAALKAEKESVKPVDDRAKRASEDFKTDFSSEIPNKVKAIFEQARWTPESTLAKLVTENLTYKLREDQKYLDTDEFIRQTGAYRNGDRRVPVAEANVMVLGNKAIAQAKELVREIQKELKDMSAKARNRALADKQRVETEKQTVPKPLPNASETFQERQERLRREFLAASQA